MSYMNDNSYIQTLYEYATDHGLPKECLFSKETQDNYINTSIDAYRDYALFQYLFKRKYDEDIFSRLMTVDFRSRKGIMAGLSTSDNYESVMLLEPPNSKSTGMIDYVKVARLKDYGLLLCPVMYRMEVFEKYSLGKRKEFLDDNTWYMYVFATKEQYKGQGYGRKLIDVFLSYINENGYRICLETNDKDNVSMYEHFGFETVATYSYQGALDHFIMMYK